MVQDTRISPDRLLLDSNALFVSLFGLYPAVAIVHSAYDAAMTGVAILLTTVAVFSAASAFRRLGGIISSLALLIAAGCCCAAFTACFKHFAPEFYSLNSFALPLVGINAAVLLRARLYGGCPISTSISRAFATGYGYALALLIYGVVRELLAYGSFNGMSVFGGIEFFASVPGGLLLIVCLAAAFRTVVRKAREYEGEPEDDNQ